MRIVKTLLILFMVFSASAAFAATSGSLFLDGNGNYGIGTAAPVAKLHIGDAGTLPTMPITGNDAYVKGNLEFDGRIYGDGSRLTGISGVISGLNAGYISRASTSTTIVDSVIYQNGGNIGIGSTAPRAKLEVDGTIYVNGNIGIGTANPMGALHLYKNVDAYAPMLLIENASSSGVVGDVAVRLKTRSSDFYLLANDDTDFFTISDEHVAWPGNTRLYIDGNGNIGIGTMEPRARLHVGPGMPDAMSNTGNDLFVKGNIEFDGRIYGDGSRLTNLPGGISGLTATRMPVASTSTTLVDSMIYSVGNNVGIGTSAPRAQLHVGAGTASMALATALGTNDALIKGRLEVDSTVYVNGNIGVGTTRPNNFIQVANLITFDDTDLNTRIGTSAGVNIVVGAAGNTFVGYHAGESGVGTSTNAADNNTAVGYAALGSNTTGDSNTALGNGALFANTQAQYNTGLGRNALASTNTGSYNTAVGNSALFNNTTGITNVAVGGLAGQNIANDVTPNTTSDYSIFIGYNARPWADNDQNEMVFGYNVAGLGSNTVLLGNSSILLTALRGNVGIGTTAAPARLTVAGAGAAAGRAFEIDNNLYSPKVVVLDNGNVGIGTVLPTAALAVGVGQPNVMTVAGGDDAYVAGNLEVDGRIYGDGAGLTNLPGGISGLNATRVPVALNSTTLVDSAIYQVSGYVGIGTTIPGAPLEVRSVADNILRLRKIAGAWNYIEFYNDTARQGYFGMDVTGANFIFAPTSGSVGIAENAGLSFYMNGGTVISAPSKGIIASGNVGIGTSAPVAQLHVGAGTASMALTTALGANDALIKGRLEVDSNLYVNANVGIGITNPWEKLVVAADIDADFDLSTANNDDSSSIHLRRSHGTHASPTIPVFIGGFNWAEVGKISAQAYDGSVFRDVADISFRIDGTAGSGDMPGKMIFSTTPDGSSVALARMSITNDGNLGIGTTIPMGKLQVDGNIYIPNIKGNVGIGTWLPHAALSVGAGAPNAMSVAGGDDAYVAGNLEVDGRIYGDGSGLTGVGGITGLNAGYISRASTSTTLVDSVIYQNTVNIGIGTIYPVGRLQVGTGAPSILPTTALGVNDALIKGRLEIDSNLYVNGWIGMGTTNPVMDIGITRNEDRDVGGYYRNINGGANAWANSGYENSVGNKAWVGIGSPAVYAAEASRGFLISSDISLEATGGDIRFYFGPGGSNIEKFRMTANGNVGIGTTVPLAKLAVVGAGAGTGRAFEIDNNLYSPKVVALDNGNIGLGTTLPQQKLEVRGGAILGSEFQITTAASMTADWSNGNQQYVALNQIGHTMNLSNYKVGQILRLVVCQDVTGGRTITTWDASITWAAGTAPTLSAASKCDVISFICTYAKGSVRNFGAVTANF